jgi:hypothetical protein
MEDETRAIRHTNNADLLAAACLLRQNKPCAAEPMTSDEVATGYARELLCTPGADRIHTRRAAAFVVTADDIAWPAGLREAFYAVELCQRAAEIAARR